MPGEDYLRIDAVHEVRVGCDEAQEGCAFTIVVEAEIAAPVRERREIFHLFVFVAEPCQIITAPVDDDLVSAVFIGCFAEDGHEIAGFDRCGNDQNLALLEVNPFF